MITVITILSIPAPPGAGSPPPGRGREQPEQGRGDGADVRRQGGPPARGQVRPQWLGLVRGWGRCGKFHMEGLGSCGKFGFGKFGCLG